MESAKIEEIIEEARHVIETEVSALTNLARVIDDEFVKAVDIILNGSGMVVTTGIGKAGIIARKISATLASTGTPSLFLHAAEALHGDLGRIKHNDVVLALSNSGTTGETLESLNAVKRIGASLISITSDRDSTLATHSDVAICYGTVVEACPMGLTPTTSTTIMLALGDALAMSILTQRKFSKEEFALYHPAGALGRQLLKVSEVMRSGDQNPVLSQASAVIGAMSVMTNTPGRPGAVSLVDEAGKLAGFYTDGDLRRRIEKATAEGDFSFLQRPIKEIMTKNPKCILYDKLAGEALRILRENKIDQIPVIDEESKPIGILDVQDLLTVRIL
ncbi:MAG: KpsF/GutQ family sugar-phosphate isomerase [Planctomycetota bacterium]|jgi:arabinose-5-phosphate isomerase